MEEDAVTAAVESAARSTVERLEGRQPSRLQALLAAGVAAVAVGTAVYKLLRSQPGRDDEGS